jgi:hypothetical protein
LVVQYQFPNRFTYGRATGLSGLQAFKAQFLQARLYTPDVFPAPSTPSKLIR